METRKITIVSTKTQQKKVIMSGAETLGELKRDLDAANIDYEDMTFYEGTSKTELRADDSYLPKNVPYTNRTTGETKNTNELVFMLTNTNKKIKSGAMSRAEVYIAIKENNLQDLCKLTYGKNYTQCSTADLISLLEKHCVDNTAEPVIKRLLTILLNRNIISDKDAIFILHNITEKPNIESSYSDEEIDNMFADMLG